jgi:hypothetical protein
MASASLLDLPVDILITLPQYLANIEDYMNTSSTCRTLRECMAKATPNTILQMAAAQTNVFFRPSPHFLVAATAQELGNWARSSNENEAILQYKLEGGIDSLMELCLEHCGLTMQSIRELHLMRFSIINPVTNIIDQCVGEQWYAVDNFWDGGRSDAYTIRSDPPVTFFHLAIYGELFGPDFEAFLTPDSQARRLSVSTRLQYTKYILRDFASRDASGWEPMLLRKDTTVTEAARHLASDYSEYDHNIALTWVINSSRWRPHFEAIRSQAGGDFQTPFSDGWWSDEQDDGTPEHWKQRLWEMMCVCHGMEGLGMIRPEWQAQWLPRLREWRRKIAELDSEPAQVIVGRQMTMEYPHLLGDLRICASGYVMGT